MSFLIEGPVLARAVGEAFDERVPRAAYEVVRRPDATLRWVERTARGERTFDHEPNAGPLQRLGVGFLAVLPIEWLL